MFRAIEQGFLQRDSRGVTAVSATARTGRTGSGRRHGSCRGDTVPDSYFADRPGGGTGAGGTAVGPAQITRPLQNGRGLGRSAEETAAACHQNVIPPSLRPSKRRRPWARFAAHCARCTEPTANRWCYETGSIPHPSCHGWPISTRWRSHVRCRPQNALGTLLPADEHNRIPSA